jgi:hypothetical protein
MAPAQAAEVQARQAFWERLAASKRAGLRALRQPTVAQPVPRRDSEARAEPNSRLRA